MNFLGDLYSMVTKREKRRTTNYLGYTDKRPQTQEKKGRVTRAPNASNVTGRMVHTLYPLGAVGGMMPNTRKIVLPIKVVAQEANAIQFVK